MENFSTVTPNQIIEAFRLAGSRSLSVAALVSLLRKEGIATAPARGKDEKNEVVQNFMETVLEVGIFDRNSRTIELLPGIKI
jgi:hypothetical protein